MKIRVALLLGALCVVREARADPATDYVLHCRGCHGPEGAGAPGAVPSFRELGKFARVPGGREYLLRVPGTSQSELPDERIAALLNWMLLTFSAGELPADFEPYSGAEVARLRRPPFVDVESVRQKLLLFPSTIPSLGVVTKR